MIEPFHLKNTEPHTKEINIAALVYLTCFKLAERLMHCKLDSFVIAYLVACSSNSFNSMNK